MQRGMLERISSCRKNTVSQLPRQRGDPHRLDDPHRLGEPHRLGDPHRLGRSAYSRKQCVTCGEATVRWSRSG